MKPALLTFLFLIVWMSAAFAGGTITWPLPPVPAGTSPTTISAPRIEWLDRLTNTIAESKKMPTIDLVFDGDSITDWWLSNGKPLWQQHYAKLNAFNFAASGDRTENVLFRLDNGQVDNLHPKMVVLLIGTNDILYTSDQIADGVKAVVEAYRKRCPDAVILLQGIFPRGALATDPARAKIKAANQIIAKLDDGKNVLYIDFGDKFLEPDGSISKDMMPDFLHPTLKGYQIWADAIQPIIDKYFPPTPVTPAP